MTKQLFSFALIGLLFVAGCTKKVDDTDTTFNFVEKANIKGLDPARVNDLYSGRAVSQIYEGLMAYHYLKRPLEPVPALADGMPTITDGGKTVTFKIKKGIYFHDNPCFPGGKGRELEAQDFIYSWRRLADPKTQSEAFWTLDGKIKGLNEWAAALKTGKADYNTPIEGLTAPDKHTLVVKLTQPYYQLLYVLTMAGSFAVPREAVEKYGDEIINNPVGTGPFMFESWVRNSKLTLKKNPNYNTMVYPSDGAPGDKEAGLLADAGHKLPFADKLIINEITEDQPRWQNFMKGNIDLVEIPNDNFENTVKNNQVVPELASKGILLDINPNMDTVYIGINMKDSVLGKSKLLRQALSMAHDSPVFIQKFYNGRAVVAHGPVPPEISSYDENFKNPYQKRDITKAKEYLAKAGYPEGKGLPEFTYDTQADSKNRQMAEFFVQNMAQIGVKVKIQTNTWPQFQDRIKHGRVQFFGVAWGADYPDAQNFFQLFTTKNFSPGPNDTSYSNPEFDRLYEKSLTLPPGTERDKIYKQLRDIVVEDAPWIFNAHRMGYWTHHSWIQNFKRNDVAYDLLKYMKVDPKRRAEMKPKL